MKFEAKNILWAFAFLLIGLAYFSGLYIDLTGDSGLYAAITRQMVESGNWFNLKINGVAYEQKPHLIFWLAGIGVKLFGNTNFAFKFFPALYGWLGFYFIYRLGRELFSAETGKLAALFTLTSQVFFLYSFDIHTDTILQTGVVLALWQLAVYLRKKKTNNFIFGFFGIGLAMLSKGPVGAVLPFFVVLLYLLLQKDFRQLFRPKWILGILIVLVVISPTLIHLYNNFGKEGIRFYFITNNFGRITGEYVGSSTDPFFYLYNSFWIFLPWTAFVFITVFYEVKSWFSSERNNWGVSLLGSVLIFLFIISIARAKSPNYFLIAVPFVFVIMAKWIATRDSFSHIKRHNLRITQIVLLVLLAVLFGAAVLFVQDSGIGRLLRILLLTAVFVLLSFRYFSDAFNRVLYISVLFAGLFNLYLNIRLVPELAKYQGARQTLEVFEENKERGDQLYNMHLEEYELFFYADKDVKQINNGEDYKKMLADPGAWLYTTKEGYEGILDNIEKPDSVILIRQRGLNEITLNFLNPKTRGKSLKNNFLIQLK